MIYFEGRLQSSPPLHCFMDLKCGDWSEEEELWLGVIVRYEWFNVGVHKHVSWCGSCHSC